MMLNKLVLLILTVICANASEITLSQVNRKYFFSNIRSNELYNIRVKMPLTKKKTYSVIAVLNDAQSVDIVFSPTHNTAKIAKSKFYQNFAQNASETEYGSIEKMNFDSSENTFRVLEDTDGVAINMLIYKTS